MFNPVKQIKANRAKALGMIQARSVDRTPIDPIKTTEAKVSEE